MFPIRSWGNTFFTKVQPSWCFCHKTSLRLRSYRCLWSDAWRTDDGPDIRCYWLVGGMKPLWVTSVIGWCFSPQCLSSGMSAFWKSHKLSVQTVFLIYKRGRKQLTFDPPPHPPPSTQHTVWHLHSIFFHPLRCLYKVPEPIPVLLYKILKPVNLWDDLQICRDPHLFIQQQKALLILKKIIIIKKRACGLEAELRHPFSQIFSAQGIQTWLPVSGCSAMYSDPLALSPRHQTVNGFRVVKTLNWIPEFQGDLTCLTLMRFGTRPCLEVQVMNVQFSGDGTPAFVRHRSCSNYFGFVPFPSLHFYGQMLLCSVELWCPPLLIKV